MADPAKVLDQNLLPVQAYFAVDGTFQTFIGQGQPFYATVNPFQSGLHITDSTIDSTTIGATTPSTGVFTNIATTTGTISSAPSGPTSIVNQAYVDAVAQGLSFKNPVVVATTTNLAALSGLLTIDGITVAAGDRVLVKNQTASATNGIYVAAAGAWSRAPDADTYDEYLAAYLFVLQGTIWGGSAWVCTNQPGGTLGTTPITFVQFSNNAVYTAGTGLTLSGFQFSITPVGTAGTYGSASSVPVFTTNASGQVTSVTNTSIAIANTQVSGLGTMSTQNANAVAITGGTINGVTIGGSTAGAITGTTITANTQFSGPGTGLTGTASGLSIGGSAASATTAGSVTNSLTINSGGAGGVSPQTFNGSSAVTISYNTVGAPSTTGTNASGTWAIGISGNAATVTNGLYSTGSYSNPTWLTSILGSIVSGAVSTATTATNVAGGAAGSLVYQSAAATTTTLALGTTNYVLTAGASAPQYVAQSTLSVGSATTSTTSTNLAGGVAGAIPWQSGAGATGFTTAGTTGQVLQSNGTSVPTWVTPTAYATVTDDTTSNAARYVLFANQTAGNLTTEYVSSTKLQYNPSTGVFTSTSFSGAGTGLTGTASGLSIGGNAATATSATSATTATNIAGGANGSLPYQTGSGATTFLAAGTNGYVLTLASGVPTWAASSSSGLTISDDTTTNATRYLTFTSATTGSITSENVSSTKLQFNPSTGTLTTTALSTGGLTNTGNETISGTLSVTGQITGTAGINVPNTFGFKNRIINGAMVIDQRNAGASVTPTAATQYTLDRWSTSQAVLSKFSVQQNAGSITPPTGFSKYLGATSLSAYTITGNDYFTLYHVTEGNNTYDFGFGTASASTITVSFWVRASIAGNYSFTIRNYGTYNRTYATSYNVPSANTWTFITLVVPGDTTGTWTGATNGGSFLIDWGIGAIGSLTTSTTGWQAGNFVSLSGTTSVVGTNGATFYITGVQLEKGSTATSFDYRPYGTELALCQRYLPAYNGTGIYATGHAYATTVALIFPQFQVPPRTPPTGITVATPTSFVLWDGSGGLVNVTAIATYGQFSFVGGTITATVASGLTIGRGTALSANSSACQILFTGCEL